MSVLRLQGLALILSAVSLLIGLFTSQASMFFIMISIILVILGIPAIHTVQPTGWIGLAGIALLELAALIALGFRLNMVAPSGLGDTLSLTSAIAGMLGAIIIGWLTTRERVFPAWVGWAFLVHGLLNLIIGRLDMSGTAGGLLLFLPVLQAVALIAYGYFIFQKPVSRTANKYGVASD